MSCRRSTDHRYYSIIVYCVLCMDTDLSTLASAANNIDLNSE